MNADGLADVLTGSLTLFVNRGDSTFAPPVSVSANPPLGAVSFMTLYDVDLDGHPDAVMGTHGMISVFANEGDGTFRHETRLSVGTGGSKVAVCDLDGDGDPDFVKANSSSDDISVLLNTTQVLTPLAGDVDGDGDVDLGDYIVFQACFRGAGREPFFDECDVFDFDDDGDVDLADLVAFQAEFTGSE